MYIDIMTDENVAKDGTKLKVCVVKGKKCNSLKKKSLKKVINAKYVTKLKCISTKKCYKIELSEKKKAKNKGMDGHLKVKFDGKELIESDWDEGRKFKFLVGKCSN